MTSSTALTRSSILQKLFICFCLIFPASKFPTSKVVHASNNICLAEGCRIEKILDMRDVNINDNTDKKFSVIMCEIKSDEFEYKEPSNITGCFNFSSEMIDITVKGNFDLINTVFRWTTTNEEQSLFDKRLNFTNALRYFEIFFDFSGIQIWSAKGFDLELYQDIRNIIILYVECFGCRLEFYSNHKRINSCEDMRKLNRSNISSLFQLSYNYNIYILRNCEFKQIICPLVFMNVKLREFMITDIVDTFYKKNVLTFDYLPEDQSSSLNSNIWELLLYNVYNINLDMKILNPAVFKMTELITIQSGSLNSIDKEIFNKLENLQTLKLDTLNLIKIIHKQGINWIKGINRNVSVNLKEVEASGMNFTNISFSHKEIAFTFSMHNEVFKISEIFPEEDFCIYVEFPFNQLVLFYHIISLKDHENIEIIIDINVKEVTCTFCGSFNITSSIMDTFCILKV